MKKIILILAVIAVSGLASCKKDYDCTCDVTFSDGSHSIGTTNIRASKKKAQAECDATAPDSDFGKTCTLN